MALKPILKLKMDELFLRWLSDPDTQQILRANLKQVLKGEAVIQSHGPNNASKSSRPMSPRVRPSSPSTPPCSPTTKTSSPRSPRRATYNSSRGSKLHRERGDLSPREREIPKEYISPVVSNKDQDIVLKERETNSNAIDAASQSRVQEKESSKSNVKEIRKKEKDTRTSTHSNAIVPPSPVIIPQFYFPMGQPASPTQTERVVQTIKDTLSNFEGGKILKEHLPALTKACGLPIYWKSVLWTGAGGEKSGHITHSSFLTLWRKLSQSCHDDAAKFVKLLAKPGSCHLVAEDFIPFVQDVVDTHPGLSFLQDAPEFHSRYVHTVISRIFYCVNRSWTGRITIPELRRSNFLQTLAMLNDEEDINRITDYFSYEHFYVIYCKFWELDTDHDLFISKEDLTKHNDHAISSRMIDRIFSGAVTRGRTQKEGKMSYPDFVCFLISEEDKRHPTSLEYWFRCMDLDGDGVLSMYEMEYFYEEQLQKMEALGIETLPFEDCLCQMLDMVRPRSPGQITLADLKACKMTPIFFDTFFNLEKYLDHEQRDPFANARDLESDEPEMSDWEKYAAEEYEILVAEEGATDGMTDEINYEDDFEPDDEELQALTEPIHLADPPQKRNRPRAPLVNTEDDIYDFSHQDLGY